MRVNEAAKILNVSSGAIRRYCNQGLLPYTKTPGGQRYITEEDIREFKKNMGMDDVAEEKIVFYVRSSSGDKHLIQAQIDELSKAFGSPSKIYKDCASGLNENRKGLQRLLRDADEGQFSTVCATYQDRLTRFGFSYIEQK